MYCGNCGKQIADGAVYCVHCGAATGVPSPFTAQPVLQEKRTNGFAIAGFVLALLGVTCGYYTFDVVPLLGLIFSIIGIVKAKTYGSGKGLGIAGLIISLGSVVLYLILIILFVGLSLFGAVIGSGTAY